MKKRLLSGIPLFTLLLAGFLALSGCDMLNGLKSVNTDALSEQIGIATALRDGTTINTNGAEVFPDRYWATAADYNALSDAIDSARTVRDSAKEQTAVDSAVTTLKSAINTFNSKRSVGTKSSGFTTDNLSTLITDAKAAKTGVRTSTNGADVSTSEYWVPQNTMTALETAITSAEAATTANRDSAYTTLAAAKITFEAAKQKGTMGSSSSGSATITVRSLPSGFANGSTAYVALFQGELTGTPDIIGMGTVSNGSITVTLTKNNQPWTENGSYKVAIGNGMDPSVSGFVAYASNSTVVSYTSSGRQQETSYSSSTYSPVDTGGSGGSTIPTGATVLRITNLPTAFANGATIYVGIFQGDLTGLPEIIGIGTVNNRSVMVALYRDNQPWTGTGSYYVGFANTMDMNSPNFVGYASKNPVVTYTATSREQETAYSASAYNGNSDEYNTQPPVSASRTTITIRDLPPEFTNGAKIYVMLFQGELSYTPTIGGEGSVKEGTATVELFDMVGGRPWTGTGPYKVAFANGMDMNDPDLVGYYSNGSVVTYTSSNREQGTSYSSSGYTREKVENIATGGGENTADKPKY